MSCNKSKINAAIEWAALYSYIYFMTKPSNPNRPHWVAEYFLMLSLFAGINMLVFAISVSNGLLDGFYFVIVNVIYLIFELKYLSVLVGNDLNVIAIERQGLKQKAIASNIQYVDPYTPNWPRRFLVFCAVYSLQFLLSDFVFSIKGSVIVIVILTILYSLRDYLYADPRSSNTRI